MEPERLAQLHLAHLQDRMGDTACEVADAFEEAQSAADAYDRAPSMQTRSALMSARRAWDEAEAAHKVSVSIYRMKVAELERRFACAR